MARQRTIKFPPKRGKLTIRQIERAVDKVIQKRRSQETITSTKEDESGKYNVFISFCADDFHDINLLRTLLKNENNNIAFSDWSVRAPFNSEKSDHIKPSIRERIHQSSVTIVYVSDKTANSEWVDWEIRESLTQGKGVLAMHKGDTRPKHLPRAIVENNIKVLPWKQQLINEVIQEQAETELPESLPGGLKSKILFLLVYGPMSISELSKQLGQKKPTGHLYNVIRDLLDDQMIEYTFPEKRRSPRRQYRLTEKGRIALASLKPEKSD